MSAMSTTARFHRLVLASLGSCSCLFPLSIEAQTATVRGRVEDAATRSAIVGAQISIEGRADLFTDSNGQFQFSNLPLAPVTLSVRALGYASLSLGIDTRTDTTILIALNPNPVRLDSLQVTTRRISVSGHLKDKAAGKSIVDGNIFASQQLFTRTNPACHSASGTYQLMHRSS